MRALAFTVLIVALCVGTVWFGARSRPVAPPATLDIRGAVETLPTSARLKEMAAESEARSKVSAETMALEVERAAKAAGDALDELALWEREVVPLLRNEHGRHLTKRSEWVEEFRALYSQRRPDEADLQSTKTTAELTRSRIQNTKTPVLISERERSDLNAGRTRAEDAARSYRSAREQIRLLVERAKSSPLLAGALLGDELARRPAAR